MEAGDISVRGAALPKSFSTAASLPGTIGHLSPEGPIRKINKKRSRASKRADTMVLSADKANFKAMVQHFTGMTSANIAASALSPISESFEEYFLPKSKPADHQPFLSARLNCPDTNLPFPFNAYRPRTFNLQNFPLADKSSVATMPSFLNNRAAMASNSQRRGVADLSSASLWEEILGMDLPASGVYTNM